MRATLAWLTVIVGLAAPPAANARSFYVASTGSDSASGLSPSEPWRTVGKVNEQSFAPGDRILFRGGDRFDDTTLMPTSSGSRGAPIVFSSYGNGMATIVSSNTAVWLPPGTSDLRFTRIRLEADFGASAFASSANGAGSVRIRIDHASLGRTGGSAIISPKASDRDWTVDHNLIADTGDSGIILLGTGFQITGNTIRNTGWSKEISWGKHGIYSKGPGALIRSNTITDFTGDGISIRFGASRVQKNRISGGPIGIAYFEYDPRRRGNVEISDNTISKTTSSGIYIDPGTDGGGIDLTRQNFIITLNTIRPSKGNGIDIRRTSGSMTILSNRILGGSPLVWIQRSAGRFVEDRNIFVGPPVFVLDGNWYRSLDAWQAAGGGTNDRFG